MLSVLITGAGKGIGTELVRQYAADGWRVFATCPDIALGAHLEDLGANVSVHQLDVTHPGQINALAEELRDQPIDVLLSNAALGRLALGGHDPEVGRIDYDIWRRMFETNTLGPMRLVEAFLDHVAASERRTIVFISSRMGSITFNKTGKGYGYRSTKAAMNAVVKSLSVDLLPRGVAAIALHPGNAKTYPTPGSRVEVSESVAGMRTVLERCTLEDTGSFYMYNGTVIPW